MAEDGKAGEGKAGDGKAGEGKAGEGKLATYRCKPVRASGEPAGGAPGEQPRFVVQQWLLVKVDDEAADRRRNPVSTQPESVLSGRTNDDVGRSR